jgi:proteic killer suppression protein
MRCYPGAGFFLCIITFDDNNVMRYHSSMIKSFQDREIERVFRRQLSRRLPQDIQRNARRKLELLDAAETLEDVRTPPANRLEKLAGNREGQYSIRINDQWRICFTWRDGDAYNVEIVDYH